MEVIQINKSMQGLYRLLLIVILFNLLGCSDEVSQLDRIRDRGQLRIAIIPTPPIYFPDESVINGYGYKMATRYAARLGAEVEIVRANTLAEMVTQLKQGKAHIGISGSTPLHLDPEIRHHTTSDDIAWHVIAPRGYKPPKTVDYIPEGTLVVAKGSRPALVMSRLKANNPLLHWLEFPGANTRQIMDQVNRGNFRLSIIDADVYTYYRFLYPETKIAFSLPDKYASDWLTLKEEDTSLSDSIDNFIEYDKKRNEHQKQRDIYFNHLNAFQYVDTVYYLKRIKNTLPKYKPLFKRAAKDNDFDERFIAAISYQESHWDPEARSPTGVRGLMMLTNVTAKRVGIKDRLDPEQSVMGGAKYLNILKQSLPEDIREPDRSWMTLAAYNIGLGHLEDARVLTQKLGDDPDQWLDVEKHLPKLSQPEWHEQTKYGFARGREPVEYVKRIRRYYDILRLYQQEELLEKLDQPLDLFKFQINSPVF